MSINSSVNVEYNNKEVVQNIIKNTLKMLERRNKIDSWSDTYKSLGEVGIKYIYEVMTNDKLKIGINYINVKLTSIVQGTDLDKYLSSNIDIRKIIISSNDTAKKVVKQITNDYRNAEFFFESELLEDIPSKVFVPKHRIIGQDERKELLSKFQEIELARISSTDVMARHLNAQIGDIIHITRPSFTAGQNIFYRRVVPGTWDLYYS